MGSLWAARGEMGMLSLTCGRWDASTLGLARAAPDQGLKIVSHLRDAKSGRYGRYISAIFLAGANFWAILGHFWAILAILCHFWAILAILGHF